MEPVVATQCLLQQRAHVKRADHPPQCVRGALSGSAQRGATAVEGDLEERRVQPRLVDRPDEDAIVGGPLGMCGSAAAEALILSAHSHYECTSFVRSSLPFMRIPHPRSLDDDRRSAQLRRPASPREIACPKAEAEGEAMACRLTSFPAATSLFVLRGATATGAKGTLLVSAVGCFDTVFERRCLGASFAGTRVKRAVASSVC